MCDVTLVSEINHYMKDRPDEVVSCAGVIIPNNDYGFLQEINVNLVGSFNIARAIDKDTKCVFIGSTSGLHGRAGWSGYCASKAGVISLVQSLAEEGYQVWCVSPGRVKTKMRKSLFPDEDQSTLLEPLEVAQVVEDCFAGKYPTGSNIIVRKGEEIEVQN
jgi:3-oxoacyl-[acyl-carrier protein] reductase